MKPPAFDYASPRELDEALALLREHGGDARVLAGGQSLVAMLNMRLLSPRVLVDITRIEALNFVTVQDSELRIGASVTQAALLSWPGLATVQPLLAMMLPWVGHYQTRMRGTVCGSIAHNDPSSELPLALALLGGQLELTSASGTRRIDAANFQTGPMMTALADDELIVGARFPVSPDSHPVRFAFREVSQRAGDFALAAFAARASQDGTQIAIGGIADTPIVFNIVRAGAIDEQLNAIAWQIGARDDAHATARFRRGLVRSIGAKVIREANGDIS
ncbi:MAG: carbon monoxide dehydrogenase [Chromatiales bacterium]|nr:carbon monoxide dehydrogenase [Chromatiales bacterium]